MYCSHCGKKVGEDMLFCPFCGKPIVIPDQDDEPAAAPAGETPAEVKETEAGSQAVSAKRETEAVEAEASEEQEKPTSVLKVESAPNKTGAARTEEDAAAELLDWNQARKRHMEADVWARPESLPEDFSPLPQTEADEKRDEPDWREEIAQKKQAVPIEKKPPEIKRGDEPPVRLEGTAPKLELDVKGAKPRGQGKKKRKPANTLVPPRTMDPNDIFMDGTRAPYEEDDPYDNGDRDDALRDSFSYEDEDEGSFFMRHLRGIVGLALFAILLLLFVIYAFSRPGQVSLARMNVAWSKEAYVTLGSQYFQAGDYAQAGLYYERALQRDPNNYGLASSAAMAYQEAGDTQKETAMLKRCAQIDPTKLEPYIYLLNLYPDAASRPWDITQLLQQGYQQTRDIRLNVTG